MEFYAKKREGPVGKIHYNPKTIFVIVPRGFSIKSRYIAVKN